MPDLLDDHVQKHLAHLKFGVKLFELDSTFLINLVQMDVNLFLNITKLFIDELFVLILFIIDLLPVKDRGRGQVFKGGLLPVAVLLHIVKGLSSLNVAAIDVA